MVDGSRTETPHAGILQVCRDLVLDHGNGWPVQHFENGSVKLTRKEGMTMTLDPSVKIEVAKVVEKVSVLNELGAAKVEWYRPLFLGMEDQFPPVAETMAEADQEKLKWFATTIEPLLRQPNSLLGRSS
ncbi:hypothetical protein RHSIM_Rhsim02G0192400 [Rhododendron simsii]|uniref:Uncharacterized protein n=1 Tax=Rhododendron simsii TaxID=118357 RepID=A0A834HA47_RHOSS|nr:hypothetical protein RHSIM_Rhsim02G0192400 [Rhododendron simsii]